jgi:hypothetical protein
MNVSFDTAHMGVQGSTTRRRVALRGTTWHHLASCDATWCRESRLAILHTECQQRM